MKAISAVFLLFCVLAYGVLGVVPRASNAEFMPVDANVCCISSSFHSSLQVLGLNTEQFRIQFDDRTAPLLPALTNAAVNIIRKPSLPGLQRIESGFA